MQAIRATAATLAADNSNLSRRVMAAALTAAPLLGIGAAATAATPNSTLVIGTGDDGLPVRRAAKMGEAFLTSGVIRLDGNPNSPTGWARRHENAGHASTNIAGRPTVRPVNIVRNGHTCKGALWVQFVEARQVVFAFPAPDEAMPTLGVDVGISNAVDGANIVFWHRKQGRYLDVTKAGDRALAGTKGCNIWFAVLSIGPAL